MKSYTYLLKHKPTGQVYYGVRTANKVDPQDDLWKQYFTSSPKIKQLIEETGADSFEYEIRKTFDTNEQAVIWESKVLRRCRVLEKDIWINQNIAGYIIPTEESNKKISEFHKGKPKSEEHRQKISEALKGKPKDYCRTDEYRAKMSKIKSGKGNAMYGKKHSPETLAKMSAARKSQGSSWNKGIPQSEERKLHQSKVMSGRKQDPDVVARRAATQKEKNYKRERKTCEHCGKNIAVNIFARYHGDRCKFK